METTIYNFSNFSRSFAEKAFQLNHLTITPPKMKNWLEKAKAQTLTELETTILTIVYEDLKMSVGSWNEQELQAEFIHPLLKILRFTNLPLKISSFSERQLKKKVKNITIQGKVDWMVASGKYEPEQPFFFIHEYKRERGGDPIGQLLATMVLAQLLNQTPPKPTLFDTKPVTYEDLPIFGCYVIGRLWFFVLLEDKEYYISDSYDATDKEKLKELFKILKAQKQLIIERVTKTI